MDFLSPSCSFLVNGCAACVFFLSARGLMQLGRGAALSPLLLLLTTATISTSSSSPLLLPRLRLGVVDVEICGGADFGFRFLLFVVRACLDLRDSAFSRANADGFVADGGADGFVPDLEFSRMDCDDAAARARDWEFSSAHEDAEAGADGLGGSVAVVLSAIRRLDERRLP